MPVAQPIEISKPIVQEPNPEMIESPDPKKKEDGFTLDFLDQLGSSSK